MLSLNFASLCFFILVATIVASVPSRTSLEENDHVNDINLATKWKPEFKSVWTKVRKNSPDLLDVAVGSRVELKCAASGFPPPDVFWITGNEPEKEIQELTKRILENNNGSRVQRTRTAGDSASISSTYVIDCASEEDQGLKYCVSISKHIIDTSTPTMLVVNKARATECNIDTPPTIVLHTTFQLTIHGPVILRCRGIGQPEPYLFWLDNLSRVISPTTHIRHTVLPNGDLQITDVKWSDMGEYICTVESGGMNTTASTFLYPAQPEKDYN